jgi:hypothetical protein
MKGTKKSSTETCALLKKMKKKYITVTYNLKRQLQQVDARKNELLVEKLNTDQRLFDHDE